MKQLSLAGTGFLPKVGGKPGKRCSCGKGNGCTVVPPRSDDRTEPFYPKKGNGRPSMPLETMLRIHFMLQWFGYSDPAMEEALHDVPLLRQVAGLDAFEDVMRDESTILRFRHLFAIFAEINVAFSEKGLLMKLRTVVDAMLIAAPGSTKNKDKKRDPEMTKTKKGNQRHFGMKAHIGVDAESGLVHTVECTTAKVADITMMEACLHGEEVIAFGNLGYHKKNRTVDDFEKEGELLVLVPTKKPADGALSEEQKAFNQMLLAVRAIIENPFRVVKKQFGFARGHYRGLAKNMGQIVPRFALANLWLLRKRMLPLVGEVRP